MLPIKDTINRKTVAGAGIAFSIFQLLMLAPGTFPLALVMLIVTPERLLATAIYGLLNPRSSFSGGQLIITELAFLLLTVALSFAVYYRKNVACAIILATEAVSYIVLAVYGRLFARFVMRPELRLIAIYTIYSGVLLTILLFLIYGILGGSKRTPSAVKITASVILLISILIPVGSALWGRTQLGLISRHIYRSDGTIFTTDVVLLLDPNPIIILGDPSYPGITKANGEYKIENIPARQYSILAAAIDHSLYSEEPIPVNVEKMRNTELDLVLVPGGSIT